MPIYYLRFLAFFLGFRYYIYRKSRTTDTISYDNRWWIVIGATFGALLGSRLLGALEYPPAFFSGSQKVGCITTRVKL